MKVLFYMRSVRQLRPYKSVFISFLERGHELLGVLDPREKRRVSTETLDLFKKEHPNFDYVFGFRRKGFWRKIIFPVRELRTFRRYLLRKEQAAFYRERWKKFLPLFIQKSLVQFPRPLEWIIQTVFFDKLLIFIEKLTLPVREITDQIKRISPDVVLVAYRNLPSAALDLEYLKAAKALGLPTAIPLLGWDTLTTKGLIQIPPDRFFVWNEEQVREIENHHHLSPQTVVITGAYQFDAWLAYKNPRQLREIFCRENGLRPEDPILLYFGFSYGIKDKRLREGHGPVVVEKLRKALDDSNDPRLKRVQIIVRPHPQHTYQFADINIRDVIVLPKTNSLMNRREDFDLLFDTLYHSLAAIAINTTAIIDASIQMKPGIVLHWEEYRSVQGGTHFKNFLNAGAMAISENPRDFVDVISGLLDGRDLIKPKREEYFKKYIRPRGLNIDASEFVVREVEALVGLKKMSIYSAVKKI